MKKWLATAAVVALGCVSVRADVTVVHTMTIEGAAAAALGGELPRVTMRIKGQKSRAEIEGAGQTIVSIVDLGGRQVIMLNPTTKTATITALDAMAGGTAAMTVPKVDVSLKATGKTQTIDGQSCDEHTLLLTLNMAELGQMPPEAAAMMKDVRIVMNGSIWVAKSAPGAAEYAAFNKAAISANVLSAVTGLAPGKSGGIDKLMEATAGAAGLSYLSEMTMTFEGEGPLVQAMKQMGAMKMVQKVASVSTETISDDLFKIPEGYTVEKK